MSQMYQAELTGSGANGLMLQGVRATGAVKGRLLVMGLEQSFRNASAQSAEISYRFPLPFGAVLLEVEVVLNGQRLKGEVTAKAEAQRRYEEALSEGNSGIMLESHADGSYSLDLGNLLAHEACSILVRYAQLLQTSHGQVRLMLPTTLAPRYGNPQTQGGLQPHQLPVTDLAAEYPFDISLTLCGDMAGANVASPSHKTRYARNSEGLVISLSQRGQLDRDFVLVMDQLPDDSSGLACMDLYAPGQYALMASFSPRFVPSAPRPLQVKVLVDCSSSMAGDSMEAARRALLGVVGSLADEDTFSLSRFGSTVQHRSRGLWRASRQALASARRWVGDLQADLGGTEMERALVSTMALTSGGGLGRSDILLVTDGEIEGIDEVIAVAQAARHRVFVVAIGASPVEGHLRRLAAATGGHCDFVAPGEDVEPAVLRMSARLRGARASQLRVEWPASMAMGWQQASPGCAFADDALVVCGFAKAPDDAAALGTVKLWGCLDHAESTKGTAGAEVLLAEATLVPTASSTNVLARLTAHAQFQQLQYLQDLGADARRGSRAAAASTQARALAVQYRLVTGLSNFILVHERAEGQKPDTMPVPHQVPHMLAAGWGGTGSVLRSAAPVADYGSRATPSVWRTHSSRAAASFTVQEDMPSFQTQDGDADLYFDIPAFLRKQTHDKPDSPVHTPAELHRWLRSNPASLWPTSYRQLQDLGLALPLCEWLEFEIGNGRAEAQVVAAFLAVVLERAPASHAGLQATVRGLQRAIAPKSAAQVPGEVAAQIRSALQEMSAQDWPRAVAAFPQEVVV